MFTSRVQAPPPDSPEPEDIFSSSLSTLFTDDTHNSHGDPGSYILYSSPRFGSIKLRIPVHPDAEEGRQLFAHYLWNAAVIVAEGIEVGSSGLEVDDPRSEKERSEKRDYDQRIWDARYWDVRGKRVLELGAGTALPSILSALGGAKSVTITDHPSSPALLSGAIQQNVRFNLYERPSATAPEDDKIHVHKMPQGRHLRPTTTTEVSIYGYKWGEIEMSFAPPQHVDAEGDADVEPSISNDQPQCKSFDKIIVADCLWMPSQHVNIVKTILDYLSEGKRNGQITAESQDADRNGESDDHTRDTTKDEGIPCALVVAGFHTGRTTVADFLRIATGSNTMDNSYDPSCIIQDGTSQYQGGENRIGPPFTNEFELKQGEIRGKLRAANMFEIDVEGNQRPWQVERPGEDKHQAKRWCVCAVLVRR